MELGVLRQQRVDEAGDQALAGPRLALDEDGGHPAAGVGPGQEAADAVPDRLDGRALAEKLVEPCHDAHYCTPAASARTGGGEATSASSLVRHPVASVTIVGLKCPS